MTRVRIVGAVFLDLSKAFDTVSHSSILSKLPSYGVTNTELKWFTDYLFDRSQVVCYGGVLSNSEVVNRGVPQGSLLGPLLFIIQLNDVVDVLKHSRIIKYADDTVIYVSDKYFAIVERKLSEELSSLSSWFHNNELILNLKKGKTVSMVFSTKNHSNKVGKLSLKLNGIKINPTKSYKYLGVYFDKSLSIT